MWQAWLCQFSVKMLIQKMNISAAASRRETLCKTAFTSFLPLVERTIHPSELQKIADNIFRINSALVGEGVVISGRPHRQYNCSGSCGC